MKDFDDFSNKIEGIGDYLKTYKPQPLPKPKGRKAWVLDFQTVLNMTRADKLSIAHTATVLRRFPTFELPTVWKHCVEADNFSKMFWYMWKLRKPYRKLKKPEPRQGMLL